LLARETGLTRLADEAAPTGLAGVARLAGETGLTRLTAGKTRLADLIAGIAREAGLTGKARLIPRETGLADLIPRVPWEARLAGETRIALKAAWAGHTGPGTAGHAGPAARKLGVQAADEQDEADGYGQGDDNAQPSAATRPGLHERGP
jgi:hypothetical protein